MKLEKYSLKVKNELLTDVSVDFRQGRISHLLGQNGVGKSCLAKSFLGRYQYDGQMQYNKDSMVVIGSYSNIPTELKVKDVLSIASGRCKKELLDELGYRLKIELIDTHSKLKRLSDGQKQKIKLLYYLSCKPEVVILDEFTNALDKESCKEIYSFFNEYVKKNNLCTVINITHNLSDLEYMDGDYYLLHNKKIDKVQDKEQIIKLYVEGD